ncbi:MAG: hypothetical protein LBG46_05760 [Elusimicrobiota bacterium]|jgi:outer membrane lipoprotein-sorting protein|nr:hypothetical protein [Elusimicrobiota bacterium]
MLKICNIFISFVFVFTYVLYAAESSLPASKQSEILNNLAAWDKNLKTLRLDYEQSTAFEDTLISSSLGRIYKKDNNIRVDILENGIIGQSALTDKKTIQILDGKGKNITTLSWREWYDAQPNKVLFDFGNYGKLLKTHKVKELIKTEAGYKITLVPAQEEPQYELEFILDVADYFPLEISISSEGVKTRTALKNTVKNTELKSKIFKDSK